MAKKAESKKESTTKKSGDQLPQSGFAKNHELYLISRVETDLLLKAIHAHYGQFGDVRTTYCPEFSGDCFSIYLFRNKQAKLPVMQVLDESWANELVFPELQHFWGPGKIVLISDLSNSYEGHEFLYERRTLEVLAFNETNAKECFFHLDKVNSELETPYGNYWWKYSQFRLLIYRLLRLGQEKMLLDYMELNYSYESNPQQCKLIRGIMHAMLHIYMVGAGAGNYADCKYLHRDQESFDHMFQEHGLELKFTDVQRIAALEALIENGGSLYLGFDEKIKKALSAIRK